jgi:hypothetical protein
MHKWRVPHQKPQPPQESQSLTIIAGSKSPRPAKEHPIRRGGAHRGQIWVCSAWHVRTHTLKHTAASNMVLTPEQITASLLPHFSPALTSQVQRKTIARRVTCYSLVSLWDLLNKLSIDLFQNCLYKLYHYEVAGFSYTLSGIFTLIRYNFRLCQLLCVSLLYGWTTLWVPY